MTRLTLRSLAARKLRTALTALAIVLGVAMISGTYVLTDTIDRAFSDIYTQAAEGVDVAVTPDEDADVPLDAALLDRVAKTPGIEIARGDVFADVALLGEDGEPIGGNESPTFAASVGPARFEPFKPVEGRLPTADGEVALDRGTAEEEGIAVGETVTVVGDPGPRRYRVSGIARYGEVDSLAGASVVLMTLREAQRMTDRVGRFDQISAAAASGVSAEAARDRVGATLRGERVAVRTGDENAAQETADTKEELSFFRTALLIFGGIALFVGAFVIYNTFTITIAQRLRELALLRTLGASRAQVLRSVVLEALFVGTGAALLGLGGGLLVAPGIVALFEAIGVELPSTDTVIAARTIVVGLAVGIGVTLVASLAPAIRATRVPPMAAMREGVGLPRRSGRVRAAIAAVLLVGGAVAIAAGLLGDGTGGQTALGLGAGAAAIFLGTALLSPQLVKPIARLVGLPLERAFGLTGRLARENAMRNPSRTASTAAALMIGLALVVFVSIFAAGFRASFGDVVDRAFIADVAVRHDNGFSEMPSATRRAIEAQPSVQTVSGVRVAESEIDGKGEPMTYGVDPATIERVYRVKWDEGSAGTFARLRAGEVVVDKNWAADNDVGVGDRLRVRTAAGEQVTLRVAGKLDEGLAGLIGGGIVVRNDTLERAWDVRRESFMLVAFRDGVDAGAARADLDGLLERQFPIVESQDKAELKEDQAGQINQTLGLFYALLALSVLISLFGIVNTLALSILERTRELGMLRAIGTSRRQIRRIVRYEAAITAMIGAVLGLVLGIAFAWVVMQPLARDGFAFALPVGTLAVLMVLAGLAGVLAAVAPARRAAKVDVLRALAYE